MGGFVYLARWNRLLFIARFLVYDYVNNVNYLLSLPKNHTLFESTYLSFSNICFFIYHLILTGLPPLSGYALVGPFFLLLSVHVYQQHRPRRINHLPDKHPRGMLGDGGKLRTGSNPPREGGCGGCGGCGARLVQLMHPEELRG